MKTAGLLALFIFILCFMDNCKAQKNDNNHNIAIEILPTFKGKQILKNKWYITLLGDSIQISKLRFYLTDFELFNTQDKRLPIPKSNYLIDAFNKQTLSFELHTHNQHNFSQITFKIGVDEKLHDAGAQSGDLDPIHGMYWAWQSGYINFKIEGKSPSCTTRKNKFQFHIGGYLKPFASTRSVALDISTTKDNVLIIDLDIATLFNFIELSSLSQVMIPGKEAIEIADILPALFSLNE